MTYLIALIPVGLLVALVLYYRLKIGSLQTSLGEAERAAAGAADEARKFAGALVALKARLDVEADEVASLAHDAAGDPAKAGGFLRDSIRDPGMLPPAPGPSPKGRLSAAHRAHPARFVAGFGRGR